MAEDKLPGLWELVQEVQTGTRNLVTLSECKYPAFMVNRALSQHIDTVMFAQMMNYYHELPGEYQMEFYLREVPKKKRWGKWAKAESYRPADLENIQETYSVNKRQAAKILTRLSEDQLTNIDKLLKNTGGVQRK